jgi:hypothetical protein
MSLPEIGRTAVVLMDSVEIGYAKGCRVGIDAGAIKDYKLGSADPAVLEYGNSSYPFSVDKMWIDSTYVDKVIAKTKVTLEFRPEGTGGSLKKYTLANCVLTNWEMTIEQEGVVLESVRGEGKTFTSGAQ